MAMTIGASGKTRRKCPVLAGALAMAVVLVLSVCLAGQALAAQKKCSVLFICEEYPNYYDYGSSEGYLDSEMFWNEMATNLAKFNFSLSRKHLNPIRYEDLRNYDIVVFSPFWRYRNDITPPEGEALVQYVKNGGSLFILMNDSGLLDFQKFGNDFWPGDIDVANLNSYCEKYFGIRFLPDIFKTPDDWNITITDLKPHPVTSGVGKFLLIGGRALKLQPPAIGVAYTGSNCWLNSKVNVRAEEKKDPGEPSGPFPVMAVSQYGSGKVVAVTDREWIPGYPGDPEYIPENHQKLLINILQWLSDKTDKDMTVNQPFSPPATAAANQAAFVVGRNDYSVNGTVFKMDVAPFIEQGRVFVPLRYLAYALGVSEKNVVWDASSQTIELHANEKTIKLTLNNQTISINNKNYRMDTSPVLRNGRLFLPARWVAEALGYTTGWDNKLQAVLIGPPGNLPDAGSLPLQASAAEKSCSVLFICEEYPDCYFFGSDSKNIDLEKHWGDLVSNLAKYNFSLSRKDLDPIKYEDLRNYDIVVFTPDWRWPHSKDIMSEGETYKYVDFTDDITLSEGEALVQYVKDGGSLLFLLDCPYDSDIINLNSYCEKYFGIKFLPGIIKRNIGAPDEKGDETGFTITNLKPHPITSGVGKFLVHGVSALQLQSPAYGVAYTDGNCWLDLDTGNSSQKDRGEPSGPFPVMAVSQYGTGKVVAANDRHWIPGDSSARELNPDNQKLLLNILQWLSNKTDKNITENQQTTAPKPTDTTPPNITIKKPLNGNIYKKGNNIEIEAQATDNLKVEAMGLYVTDPSGKEIKIARVPVKAKNYTFKYTLKTDKFKDGKYVIKVTAVDPSNNFAFKTVEVLYNVTKLGNVIVYRYDALELAKQSRLYVVGDNGAIYKKKIKNNGSTDDEFICRDEIFQGRKGQVFISGDRDAEDRDKLYWNTEKEDRLYSIIPEKLSKVNQIIEEQKIIWQGADNAYYGKSGYKPQTIGLNIKNEIQKKADARAEAYRKAKKGDFSDPLYKEMEKRSFIAKTGDEGEKVREIQGYLKEFCSSQKVDGKYGPVTFNNAAYFQIINKKNNPKLDVTGYVDELTYELLKNASGSKFLAKYFNNTTLSGSPVFTRYEDNIDYDWGTGGPGNGINTDNFSVRWEGRFKFNDGVYIFSARTDDGIRMWIDKNLVIDAWDNHWSTDYYVDLNLSSGYHDIVVEYYESNGSAVAQVSWKEDESPRPEWRKNIRVGDILFEPHYFALRDAKSELVKIFCGHVGIYIGNNLVIEAVGNGVSKSDISEWDNKPTTGSSQESFTTNEVYLLRVTSAPDLTAWKAAQFARLQIGQRYCLGYHKKTIPNSKEEGWYCSELVWASYYNQRINIDSYDGGLGEWVVPWEIFADDDVKILGCKSRVPLYVGDTDPKEGDANVRLFEEQTLLGKVGVDPDGNILNIQGNIIIRFPGVISLKLGPNREAIKLVDENGKIVVISPECGYDDIRKCSYLKITFYPKNYNRRVKYRLTIPRAALVTKDYKSIFPGNLKDGGTPFVLTFTTAPYMEKF